MQALIKEGLKSLQSDLMQRCLRISGINNPGRQGNYTVEYKLYTDGQKIAEIRAALADGQALSALEKEALDHLLNSLIQRCLKATRDPETGRDIHELAAIYKDAQKLGEINSALRDR